MRVVIAGGSGALGRRLADRLSARGDEVVILTRRHGSGRFRQVVWDGVTVGPWADELTGAAVVNLAGALVDRRPTAENVDLLTRSRVQPTLALVKAVNALAEPVPVFVQASTTAIYGDAGDALLDEVSAPGDGLPQMTGVARAWEAASSSVRARTTIVLRTSIVLDTGTPALERLVTLARWGLGGRVGNGQQWFSWIHIDDWLAVVLRCLDGALTLPAAGRQIIAATAPHPVRNVELMGELRRVLRRPVAPPTPAWLVRLGCLVLRTDPALALTGRRVSSTFLSDQGFVFKFPLLSSALAALLAPAAPETPSR